MPGLPWVREGKLTFPTQPTHDSILVGDDTWQQWLGAPETTAFRFEDEGTAFTARRELRRGHTYWYAYRRRGPKLAKAYLGRSEEIDLERLVRAAAKLFGSSSSSPKPRTRAPPSIGRVSSHASRMPTPATRLVGREREVASAREHLVLPEVSLLTFTGPGGTGKTRLAVEVATGLTGRFADGVHFVDLAPIRDPALVHVPIAHALGIRDAGDQPLLDTLRLYLQPRQLLLVLDNFEQIIAAAAFVADLLESCPAVKFIVTSREPLHLSWEHEWPVLPLALPRPDSLMDPDLIAQAPAVTLFVERARAGNPDFRLTDANARIVAEICTRLDGLPLAIELAAARVKLLPLPALHARLVQSLLLLTEGPRDAPMRHHTLRAAIAWSYELLDKAEQATFRRLSIFVGGFTIEASEVARGEDGLEKGGRDSPALMVDLLQSLLDKNLIRSDASAGRTGPEARFRMLETIREFGLEQLAANGELAAIQERHARHFLALAEEGDRHMRERVEGEWLDRLEADHDNLRAALHWSLAAPGWLEVGARLAGALWLLWAARGHFSSGRAWFGRILARADDAALTPRTRVRLLSAATDIARHQGDYEAAARFSDEGIAVGRRITGPSDLAMCLAERGFVACLQSQYALAHAVLDQGLVAAREVGDERAYAYVLAFLGILGCLEGEYARARSFSEESLGIFRKRGEQWGMAVNLDTLGTLARRQGQYHEARALHEESITASHVIGDKNAIALALANLGHVARALGDDAVARARYGESLQIHRELGDRRGMALVLGNLGVLAERAGDRDRARDYLSESVSVARLVGDERLLAAALNQLAGLSLAQGDLPATVTGYAQSLRLSADLQDKRGIARTLEGCASLLCAASRPAPALELCAMSDALLDSLAARRAPADQARFDELRARIQREFGSAPAVAIEPSLDPRQIVERALALIDLAEALPTRQRALPRADEQPLSPREREIAACVARGWTNQEMADALIVSRRTVESHISHILDKLGLTTRAQVAVWATQHGLLASLPPN